MHRELASGYTSLAMLYHNLYHNELNIMVHVLRPSLRVLVTPKTLQSATNDFIQDNRRG